MNQKRKHIGISGSGVGITDDIERNIREKVHEIVSRGDVIVTGGVLGTDFIATDEALKIDPTGGSVIVWLPAPLYVYLDHFRNREDVINIEEKAQRLTNQLEGLFTVNPDAIKVEGNITLPENIDGDAYRARNLRIIGNIDKLCAFQVNESKGTQYAIDQARDRNIPVTVNKYTS